VSLETGSSIAACNQEASEALTAYSLFRLRLDPLACRLRYPARRIPLRSQQLFHHGFVCRCHPGAGASRHIPSLSPILSSLGFPPRRRKKSDGALIQLQLRPVTDPSFDKRIQDHMSWLHDKLKLAASSHIRESSVGWHESLIDRLLEQWLRDEGKPRNGVISDDLMEAIWSLDSSWMGECSTGGAILATTTDVRESLWVLVPRLGRFRFRWS
jgi:hypothetical protein